MIISHRHKFIFFKPFKVAGTSVELTLRKFCGPDDTYTSLSIYDPRRDDYEYDHKGQNVGSGSNHMTPMQVRKFAKYEVWKSYFKFTIVRNPWDMVVSRHCWDGSNKDIASTIEKIQNSFTNDPFYFDPLGNLWCDYHIRYEKLQDDFDFLCRYLGIQYSGKLPKTKNKVRDGAKHYSEYYNDTTKNMVANKFSKQIKQFKYDF